MNDAWQRPKRTIHRFPDSLSGDTLHARESPILDNFAASVSIYLMPIPSRVCNHSLIPTCVMNTYIRGEGVSMTRALETTVDLFLHLHRLEIENKIRKRFYVRAPDSACRTAQLENTLPANQNFGILRISSVHKVVRTTECIFMASA